MINPIIHFCAPSNSLKIKTRIFPFFLLKVEPIKVLRIIILTECVVYLLLTFHVLKKWVGLLEEETPIIVIELFSKCLLSQS